MDRKDFLRRLILGLEDGIERTKYELPYYRPDELEGRYAKKFLKAMEDSLVQSREELERLEAAENEGGQRPPGP